MNRLTEHLQNYLLKPVEFVINDKTVRKGKLTLFNFKQYFIKFNITTDAGDVKSYDVLYPFKIYQEKGNCVFNYHLSCFTQSDYETFFRIKTLNKDKCLPTYDSVMILKTSS